MKARVRAALFAAGLCACAATWAAGGHHAVDDAIILATGECELESWAARADGGNALAHAGVQCGALGLELGVAAEPVREAGKGRTFYGAQLKWAGEWHPGWHAGLSLTTVGQTQERPQYVGTGIAALLTWMPREDLAIHLNAGRDLLNGQADQGRHGAAVDWSAHAQWTFTIERYLADATRFLRAGARWVANERWSLDLSRALSLRGERASSWTLGATFSLR